MSESRFSPGVRQRTMLVLADSFPNVSETFIDDHVRSMVESGWKVTLLVRKLNAESAAAARAIGVGAAIHVAPAAGTASYFRALVWIAQRPWSWAVPFAWRCALHGARIACSQVLRTPWDVVHAHYGNNGVSVLVASPEWADRLTVNFHGYDVTCVPARDGWATYQNVLGRSHAIAHSAFVEERLKANTRLQVHRVTMGVDLERFTARDSPSWWPDQLHLACVGRLTRQKGQAVAIDAVRWLRVHNPGLDVHLTIVGDGPERRHVAAMIDDLALSDRIHIVGPRQYAEMPGIYARCHVLLAPFQNVDGQQEAFSRVAVESMACGVPVIGCPTGALPDTIGPGGTIADGFDGIAVARALIEMMARHTPREWANLARARALEFGITKMSDDYLSLANRIADEAGGCNAR